MTRPLLRGWQPSHIPLPTGPGVALNSWACRRDHHCYVITLDPLHPDRGYGASYQDARQNPRSSRFLGDTKGPQHPTLAEAQDACEADLRRLLGRLS